MSAPQVIVVGSYVQDHAWFVDRFPQTGETRRAHDFNTGPGGKGFNQAIACARQGVATAFVGSIGADHLGAIAKKFGEDENLPCRWQVHADRATAASSIVVGPDGSNRIAVSLGANEHLDAAFVRAQRDLFADAKLLLVQLENNLDAIAAAMDIAREHALVRVMNPAPAVPELTAQLLGQADLVTPNETEFALLLDRFADTRIEADSLAERDSIELHKLACKLELPTVVVTLGAHGCFVSHRDDGRAHHDGEAFYRVPPESVKAIDTTGAGDAFSGALCAALVRLGTRAFREAVVHANRSAAMSTEIVGTAPAMARFEEVVKRFG